MKKDEHLQKVAAQIQSTIHLSSHVEEPDTLDSENQTSTPDYTKLPNYESIRHFEEPMTDEEFLEIVVNRLNSLEIEVTYKVFKQEFLPKHRKPLFRDYARFRLLEKVLLDDETQS